MDALGVVWWRYCDQWVAFVRVRSLGPCEKVGRAHAELNPIVRVSPSTRQGERIAGRSPTGGARARREEEGVCRSPEGRG